MKAVVAAYNQEKALVGAFSVITNLRMDLFEALAVVRRVRPAAAILKLRPLSPISQVPRIESFRSELIITGTNFMDIPCPGDLTKHGSLRGISIVAGF